MMNIDWGSFNAHIPLPPGDPGYVKPPDSVADEIVNWIRAGKSTLLLGGPAGVGKSTELARACDLLKGERHSRLLYVDRYENMRRVTPERLCLRIASLFSGESMESLERVCSEPAELGGLSNEDARDGDRVCDILARKILVAKLHEAARSSVFGRVALFIDGLEKIPLGGSVNELFGLFGSIPDSVDLVVVVPWHYTFGKRSGVLIEPEEQFVSIRAVDMTRDSGFDFMVRLFERRVGLESDGLSLMDAMGVPDETIEERKVRVAGMTGILAEASRMSGGSPRTFLQIMADAGFYAYSNRLAGFPEGEDMADACADQVDSIRRLFLPGDIEAIPASVGTDGWGLDIKRRMRLMAHGVLLERVSENGPVLCLHPQAVAVIEGGSHA